MSYEFVPEVTTPSTAQHQSPNNSILETLENAPLLGDSRLRYTPYPQNNIPNETLVNEELVSRYNHVNEGVDNAVPEGKGQLGLVSVAFLIFNRMVGTGIFATPSVILRSSGSVGVSLLMWLLGASVAACGTAVYIELGTGLPRSGGEKNYLDFIYRRPKFLVTCVYATYAVPIGWQSAACSVFGEYFLHALDPSHPPSPRASRFASLLCLTFAFLMHSTNLKWGVRVQNALGVFKLFVLISIALSGLAVLIGLPGFKLQHPPNNLEWKHMWKGSGNHGANAFVTGLYNVIWCFDGYSNANYALSEVHNPVRAIKVVAPVAVISITVVYMLINVAYYAVVDKIEILGSGHIVVALFFQKLYGAWTARVLSAVIALSTMGSILAILFSHGRGLFAQFFVTAFVVTAVPPGDAYLFMLNMSSYPVSLINSFVSGGLLLLHIPSLGLSTLYKWNPPFATYRFVIAIFFVSNVFLVLAPLVPPEAGFKPYARLPYWLHVFTGLSMSLIGITYWYIRFQWMPQRGGYVYVREKIVQDDGVARRVFRRMSDSGI